MPVDDEISRELAVCLEQLRLVLAGIRAGGVDDWMSTPEVSGEAVRPMHDRCGQFPSPLCEGKRGTHGVPAPGKVYIREAPLPVESSGNAASEYMPAIADSSGPSSDSQSETSIIPTCAPDDKRYSLADILGSLAECSMCRLHAGRKNPVFGEGSVRSGIVFVGEGPGFEEDQQGRPFVGRAGKLLDKMINAIGFERSDSYICNVVKCRPPENRTPLPDEVAACSPFLFRQIETLRPKVICALGACAAQTLLGTSIPVSQARRKVHLWRGIPLICTYHPAYLLRNSAQKAAAWQDLKEVLRVLRQAGH